MNNKPCLNRGRCWLLVPLPAATQTDAGAHTTAAEQQSRSQDQTGNIFHLFYIWKWIMSRAKTALFCLSGMSLCVCFLWSDSDHATIDHIKGKNGHTKLDRVNTNTSPAHIRHISDDAFFLAGILPSSVRPTPTQVPQTGAQTLLNKTRFDSTAGGFTQVAPDPRCGRNKERPDFVIGRIMKFIFRIGALRRSNKNKYQRCCCVTVCTLLGG